MLCGESARAFESPYLQFYTTVSSRLLWQSLGSYSVVTSEISKGLSKSVSIGRECILV